MSASDDLEKLFNALHRHKALITETHLENNGFVNETSENDKAVAELVRLGIFWRMDDEYGRARLSQSFSDVLNTARRDELRRHVNVDIGERLISLEELVSGYRNAKRIGTVEEQELSFRTIEEQLYSLREVLSTSSRQLWKEIESEFAYVTTLELKLQENQRVIDKVKRLNESLSMLDYKTLSGDRFAGSDPRLRRLFTGSFVELISNIREELVDALYRLDGMLFAFRKQQRQGRIVQAFNTRFQRQPGFMPSNYAGQSKIPGILNQAAPLTLAGHVDLDSDRDEITLTDLIKNLRKDVKQQVREQESERIKVTDSEALEMDELKLDALSQAVQDFYLEVINKQSIRAMSYYDLAPENCAEEIWLFAIASKHNMLSPEELAVFSLEYIDVADPFFNGLHKVKDLQVSTRY
jgi:hypothetical protein